jgi:glycosyltransferase involved in cell wall biosynthesis
MRVAVDISALRQTRAGTARYLNLLLPELERHDDVEVRPFAWGGSSRAAAAARDLLWYPLRSARVAADADVVHFPSYRGPFASAKPMVVTVHDLALFRHPDAFRAWSRAYGRLAVARVLRATRRVIAVSDFTRRELLDLFGVDDGRIRVVPNAVAPVFTTDGPASSGEYVLGVGTLEPRKNLARLAEATRGLGVELRIVGGRGWGSVDVESDGVQWLGEVGDDELAALYRGARCLAYPSLYEGFGIPILEAMACGTPVVTSRGTGTEEVAGGCAVLVDPRDVHGIAAGIEQAAAQRDRLRRLGLQHVREFTPARLGTETTAVYREAAG